MLRADKLMRGCFPRSAQPEHNRIGMNMAVNFLQGGVRPPERPEAAANLLRLTITTASIL